MTRLLIFWLWPFAQWLGGPFVSRPSQRDMPRGLSDMPQQILVDFTTGTWGFKLLAYCTVTGAICQRLPQPLCEVPTLASRLDAESLQNPPDLENLFLHRWMRYRYRYWTDHSFKTGDFLAEKKARNRKFRPNLPLHGFSSTTFSWHCPFKVRPWSKILDLKTSDGHKFV
jgi:hypothetical protein